MVNHVFSFLSSAYPPPPEDLTDFIVKCEDQYSEAGNFGDVYRCLYDGSLEAKEVRESHIVWLLGCA